jgi:uncharacterized protein DUF5335
MRTIEVAQRDWAHALNEFSALHQGSSVSVDLMVPDVGLLPRIRHLPLRGVTAEATVRGPEITISAADGDGEHMIHIISEPTHVRLERTVDGDDVELEIESSEGTTAIIRFDNA